jgi:outer membrane lipoprotein carrier protein
VTRRLTVATLASLLFLMPGSFPISAQNPREVVGRFEHAYRSAKTLQAHFFQRYLDNGREVRSEAGVAYFGRPGKMRWEYQSPEPNLYIIDGKWAWFYVPADHTVTRTRAKQSSDWRTPLAILAGEMKVSRICARSEIARGQQPVHADGVVLSCQLRGSEPSPSAASNAQTLGTSVLFEVQRDTGELSRILVTDPGGVQVEFRFANWKFDPRIDAALFRFAPPRGVTIVDGDFDVKSPADKTAFGAELAGPSR